MAKLNNESCHSPDRFSHAGVLGFLKLQVIPRFTGTGTCISPVPVNRNRGILTSLLFNAALIRGRRSLKKFDLNCGAQSGAALNRVNTVIDICAA